MFERVAEAIDEEGNKINEKKGVEVD